MTRFRVCPRIWIVVSILVVVGLACSFTGCDIEPQGEGFAIYLIEQSGNLHDEPDLNDIEIGAKPLIGLDDIVCYHRDSHELILISSAFAQYLGIEGAFAVCVDRQPVYTGVFWNWFSSMSLPRIVILDKMSVEYDNIIIIQMGYPGEDLYQGHDPRNDERIIDSLRKAGKLVEVTTCGEEIPTPFKGWELYSFQRDGEWYYTLIYGTNRLKWHEEIVFQGESRDEDGIYYRIGTGEIISLLSRLAEDSPVYWGIRFSSDDTPESNVVVTIPDEDVVNTVTHYANEFGLDFYVHQGH